MDSEIKTYSTLWNLVNIDKNEHKLKEIATLFLVAMNNWPTYNQELISDFLRDFREYYGFPVTLDKIDSKNKCFEGENAFKMESGSSIAEVIELSKLYFNEVNFEKVIQDILEFYNSEFKKVDFIAELKYFTTEQGGRKTLVNSGYRPQVKFDFSEHETSGQQTFIDKKIIYPGENVTAKIKMSSPDFFLNSLEEGMNFEIKEGPKIIGNGKIKNIINDKLDKKASR